MGKQQGVEEGPAGGWSCASVWSRACGPAPCLLGDGRGLGLLWIWGPPRPSGHVRLQAARVLGRGAAASPHHPARSPGARSSLQQASLSWPGKFRDVRVFGVMGGAALPWGGSGRDQMAQQAGKGRKARNQTAYSPAFLQKITNCRPGEDPVDPLGSRVLEPSASICLAPQLQASSPGTGCRPSL